MRKFKLLHLCVCLCFCLKANGQRLTLSDEFNNPCSMEDWTSITEEEGWAAEHLEAYDVSLTTPGNLMMMPWSSSWYQNFRGAYLFKEITGDFVFTTQVTVLNRQGNAVIPTSQFSLAGMLIRGPRDPNTYPYPVGWQAGQEDYVFLSIGRGGGGGPPNGSWQYEVKTTDNSNSQLDYQNVNCSTNCNSAQLRMIRKDNAIVVMYRSDADWIIIDRFPRADFPETVQIGFVTYTDWPNVNAIGYPIQNNTVLNNAYDSTRNWQPDLIAHFDYARFDSIDVPPQIDALNLSSPGVSGDTILAYFGYESNPTYAGKTWLGTVDSDWNNASNWLEGSVPIAGENVIVPNCSCTHVHAPVLPSNVPVLASFMLEEGASLDIPAGHTLTLDLSNGNAFFINGGTLHNYGTILITNSIGKTLINESNIVNHEGSTFTVE